MSTLSLDDIVKVNVSLGPVSRVRTKFDLALIVGSSNVIDAERRVKTYSSTTDMKLDGWSGEEAEYLAAQLYFSQRPKPSKIAIGVRADLESASEAVASCRKANTEWYSVYVADRKDDLEIIEVANYIESATPEAIHAYNIYSEDVLNMADDNILDKIDKKGYKRTIGQHSSTDHAVMAIIGYAMGANTQTENSAYDLKFKTVAGVKPEKLKETQLAYLKKKNCNTYITRGSVYNMFEEGNMADGTPFDEVLYLDMLINDIQTSVIRKLQNSSKSPQTEPGMSGIKGSIIEPLEKFRSMGFIAPGVWKGEPILDVKEGDALPRGYMIESDSIDEQSQTDRESRKAPPIYVLVKLAGSIRGLAVNMFVNR